MLDQTDSQQAELFARAQADERFPLAEVGMGTSYYNPVQRAFILAYGYLYTCRELTVVLGKTRESVRVKAKQLGVQLVDGRGAPGQTKPTLRKVMTTIVRRVGPPRIPAPDPAKAHQRQVFRLCGISPQVGQQYRQDRISIPESRLSESVRRYKPLQPDLDAGWFLNNWILHKMGLRKMGPEGCSFIAGDPAEPGWSYCGKKRTRGSVYCEGHRAKTIDHTKQPQEKEPKNG